MFSGQSGQQMSEALKIKPTFVLSGQPGQQVSKALKIKPAIMLSGQYGQQISDTYRGGSECAFTPINFEPLSKNYIMLFSHCETLVQYGWNQNVTTTHNAS